VAWLLRDGDVLATAEVATTRGARRRGLLGRDGIDGALVLQPCRQVHTIRMRFPIDVVWCARDGRVLRIRSIARNRVSRIVWRASFVIEAELGATERWGLKEGDVVTVDDNARAL